jgi:TPR repeat protein
LKLTLGSLGLVLLGCGAAPQRTPPAPSVQSASIPSTTTTTTTTQHRLGRFVVELPARAKLLSVEEGAYDEKTSASFDLGDGGTLLLSARHRGPGNYCERILERDVETLRAAKVPGAVERTVVGGKAGLLAVGTGVARLELCKPHEVLLDAELVLPNREVGAAERDELLAVAASFTRRPVADTPTEQCTEKEVASACRVACDGGDAMSCVLLGHLTYRGDGGVARDQAAGRALFQRACSAGLAKGCRAFELTQPR